MTSYSVFYSRLAEKYLLRFTRSKAQKIVLRIDLLAINPLKQDNNISKLTGTKSSFRLRIGDIRVIYFLNTNDKSIYITKIAPRESAYSM